MCHLHNVRLCIPLTIYVLNFLIGNTKDKSAIETTIAGHFNCSTQFGQKINIQKPFLICKSLENN